VLVAAGVCPHPPLLVPGVGRAAEVASLRLAAAAIAATVVDARADVVFVVGADTGERQTSFAPWAPGVVVEPPDVPEPLPLPLLVGAHLTPGRVRSFVVVDRDLPPADCADVGADLATAANRVALLVMGDGAARHSTAAPGYLDERAAGWEDAAHRAFAAADPAGLLDLDPGLGADLLAVGRAPWQVLAGAADEWRPTHVQADLRQPFGVGYHFVTWSNAGAGASLANVSR
jgi:hypothetical protein